MKKTILDVIFRRVKAILSGPSLPIIGSCPLCAAALRSNTMLVFYSRDRTLDNPEARVTSQKTLFVSIKGKLYQAGCLDPKCCTAEVEDGDRFGIADELGNPVRYSQTVLRHVKTPEGSLLALA